jgi:hypothetical protein
MKSFSVLLALVFAQSVLAGSLCLEGTLTRERSSTPVRIHLLNIGGGAFRVIPELSLNVPTGAVSGVMSDLNVVQFNRNDDYIPGGNASFNTDMELHFYGDAATTGFFETYTYVDHSGVGGFGQKGGVVSDQGTITLKDCR